MKRIAFITPPDAGPGFKLTGADQYLADEGNLTAILKSLTLAPDTGLIVIDERLMTNLNEEKMKELEQAWRGIMLVLPSPERAGAELEDYASRLIRRAIGYHVRLNI